MPPVRPVPVGPLKLLPGGPASLLSAPAFESRARRSNSSTQRLRSQQYLRRLVRKSPSAVKLCRIAAREVATLCLWARPWQAFRRAQGERIEPGLRRSTWQRTHVFGLDPDRADTSACPRERVIRVALCLSGQGTEPLPYGFVSVAGAAEPDTRCHSGPWAPICLSPASGPRRAWP